MIEFYKKLAKSFAVLVVATLVAATLCLFMFFGSDQLLPAQESPFPWRIETIKDQLTDNASSITVLNQTEHLEFERLTSSLMSNC